MSDGAPCLRSGRRRVQSPCLAAGPHYPWRCDVRLSSSTRLVVVVVSLAATPADGYPQRLPYAGSASVAGSVGAGGDGRADPGGSRAAARAADDARADIPGARRAVAAVRRTAKATENVAHPDWCDPARCGHLVPPLMAHMARRHRGEMQRVGDKRALGLVVTYLIGGVDQVPLVAVHAASRAGSGWAELSLSQAVELVEHLSTLLAQAGDEGSADGEG